MSDISSIKQTSELTGNISKINMQKDDAKAALQDLFDDTYFNGGQDSIDGIEKEIKELEKQIDGWQTKLDGYEKQLKDLEDNVKNKSKELSDVISNINDETRAFEEDQKRYVDEAIAAAVKQTKSKNNPPQINTTFEREFKLAIEGMPVGSTVIDALYDEEGILSGTVEDLFSQIDGIANQAKGVMNQVTNVKATINLLNQTKNNMSAQVESLYQNKNNDSKIPVYSYEKETIVSDIAKDLGIDLKEKSTGQQVTDATGGTRDEKTIKNLTDQLKALGNASTGTGDSYAAGNGNQMMDNLATAVFGKNKNATTVQEDSIVYQLAKAGASNTEIMDLLASTFSGVHITKDSNGTYSIPYGHGDGTARRIYGAVLSVANNTAGIPEPIQPPAGDPKLLEQASGVVDKLAASGFTFKEAMYALDQLFPGLDIGYSLGEQSDYPQGVVRFSANESYTPLAEKIKGYTGADGVWKDSKVIQDRAVENKPQPTKRTDPISVKDGNSRFYFMADDGNGQYDGVTDMLGYENGMEDFQAKYGEYIKDGVISGDALNNIMVMKLEEVDNHDGSVGVKQSFMSAADAGITEINLNDKPATDDYNINNSNIQNTFTVTMNGQKKTGEQAMEDDEYLAATLNNEKLTGANLFSQLTTDAVNKAWTDSEKEVYSDPTAQYLKNLIENLDDYKQNIQDAMDNMYTEQEFKDMIQRRKEEADYIANIAAVEGDTIYNQQQANYSMNNRDMDYTLGGKQGAKTLVETVQEGVTEKIQEKYPTYGMSDAEYEEYTKNQQAQKPNNQ